MLDINRKSSSCYYCIKIIIVRLKSMCVHNRPYELDIELLLGVFRYERSDRQMDRTGFGQSAQHRRSAEYKTIFHREVIRSGWRTLLLYTY